MSKISELSDGGALQSTDYLIAVRSGGNVKVQPNGTVTGTTGSFSGNVTFADNAKAIFGAGSDLQIYHTGAHSYIDDTGTGNLYLNSNGAGTIITGASETQAQFFTNGAVNLFYDNSQKLATTGTGIDVTGTVTADGLTVQKNGDIAQFTNGARSAYLAADSGGFSLFTGDGQTGNGLYASEAGTYAAIYTNSSEKVRITSAGNVGIGTASPGFKLDINAGASPSAAQFQSSSSTYADFLNGTITGRIQTISSDFFIGTATAGASLAFKTGNNAEAMRIDSAGNVGIGTTSPAQKLHVYGSNATAFLDAATGTSYPTLQIGGSGATSFSIDVDLAAPTTNGTLIRTQGGAYPLRFGTNTTERMRIDSAGNVGIGTTSPSKKLDIRTSSAGEAALALISNDDATGTGGSPTVASLEFASSGVAKASIAAAVYGNDWLSFRTGSNTERMRLTTTGLGIGTAASGFNGQGLPLVVGSGSGNTGMTIYSGATGYGTIQFADAETTGAGSYAGVVSYNHNSDFMYFSTAASERMRIDSSGNVCVTSSGGLVENGVGVFMLPAGELRVKDNTEDGTSQLSIYNNNTTNDSEQFFVAMNGGSVEMGNRRSGDLRFKTNDIERARIDSSGNLLVGTTTAVGKFSIEVIPTGTARSVDYSNTGGTVDYYLVNNVNVGSIGVTTSATSYNTSSDARLKHDIVDAPDASNLIDAIKVRSFKWNVDNSEQRYGMVAQELLEVAPEAVSQGATEEDMMGVDYSKLVPMLVKEIQSLRARVAQLEGA